MLRYDKQIRICMSTDVGTFSFSRESRLVIISLVCFWFFSRNSRVEWAWRMLARRALAKSSEKIWISIDLDFSSSLRTH